MLLCIALAVGAGIVGMALWSLRQYLRSRAAKRRNEQRNRPVMYVVTGGKR